MPPAAVASGFMTQPQSLSKHRPQSFSIDFHVCALHFWTACLPAQRCYFGALDSDNQCIEMCSKYRRRVQHLSSIHLCCLLYRCEIHTLHVSPLGVYDEDSQWMIQVNRLQKLIDRLEQKVASFLSTFLSPLLSFLLFSSTCNVFFKPSSASSLHNGHLVFTSLA